ncbi:uncharacterized protein TRIADDRAFT_23032, partial [Trichoplax adhaerens]
QTDQWTFDNFYLSDITKGQPLRYMGYELFHKNCNLLNKFDITVSCFDAFLQTVQQGYAKYDNPYHNVIHATDVLQTVYYLTTKTGLLNWLTDLEVFALLLAAAIHDYEHTGTTNSFLVASGSELALMYNDRSVLENHHISCAFRVITQPEHPILKGFSYEQFREIRCMIIDMVLATDMTTHFQQVEFMKRSLLNPKGIEKIDRTKVLNYILHCADISHPAKSWELHSRWTNLLMNEFFKQGELEHQLGLPYSPLCDKTTTKIPESQVGFINFIVNPLFDIFGEVIDKISHHVMNQNDEEELRKTDTEKPWIQSMRDNHEKWLHQCHDCKRSGK